MARADMGCVDAQFASLELPGDRTAQAAAYRDQRPDVTLPDLDAKTALLWCRALGIAQPDLQSHWPARQDPLVITAGTDAAARKDMLTRAATLISTRFEQDWNMPLVGRVVIIGGGTEPELNALLVAGRTAIGLPPKARIDADRFCGRAHTGAFAGRGMIGFCWPRDGQDVTIGGLMGSMAHEMTHQLQYELVPNMRPSPGWMVEGTAEVFEFKAKGIQPDATGKDFFNLQTPARRSRLSLSDLTDMDAMRGAEAYGVARFAAVLLARKHGSAALVRYFAALGQLGDPDLAFSQTFGQSFAQFEAEFDALRRDFSAAQAYR